MPAGNGTGSRMSTSALAARVKLANQERRPLRIAGAGTWKSAAPADATNELSTRALDQVAEYVPGDLTITVGAGMTLSKIETITAEHGQWLTLDPYGSPDGTIGATIATASSGPLATGFGQPRDLVLGVEAVMGRGSVIRAGGRVVKNVAGFDVTRLLTGSRGTIGVITEVPLRLRARPAVDETIAIDIGSRPGALRDAIGAVRAWPAVPMAAEVLSPRAAGAIGLRAVLTLLLRLGGNARMIAAMNKRATSVGGVEQTETQMWTRLRALDLDAVVSFRVGDVPTAFIDRWEDALALAGDQGIVTGSPLRGQVRCIMPSIERTAIDNFRSRAKSATLVYDALPSAATWNSLTSVPTASTLHARVLDAFDPVGIMNPGAMRIAR
jgi:glycolate oxidase FAD binding subunit